jgi:hypothetical protein
MLGMRHAVAGCRVLMSHFVVASRHRRRCQDGTLVAEQRECGLIATVHPGKWDLFQEQMNIFWGAAAAYHLEVCFDFAVMHEIVVANPMPCHGLSSVVLVVTSSSLKSWLFPNANHC